MIAAELPGLLYMLKNYLIASFFLFAMNFSSSIFAANADEDTSQSEQAQQEALATLKTISKGIQGLKDDVVSLNKDLRSMEETLLFPSSTKYSVFVSMSPGDYFTLESIKLKLDGKLVATHIYSEAQRQALSRGGVQKLYITNLNEGKHTATAFFTGLGPNGRAYKLANTVDFEKGNAGEFLQLAIRYKGDVQEPYVYLKQW